MKKIDLALEGLKKGFNCAQAVSSAFSGDFGLKSETVAKMSCALGAGMSRCGEVCGAVSGALMVLGLKYGSSVPEDTSSKERSYQAGIEFKSHFEAKHATVICRKLIGTDISTREGLEAARKKGVFEDICVGIVKDSVNILEEMLKKQ